MSKRTPTTLTRWITACVALLISHISGPSFAANSDTVRIGILNTSSPEQTLKAWGGIADYLSNNIPGHTFQIVPLDFEQLIPSVAKHQVDFLLTNPVSYSILQQSHDISAQLTLERQHTPYFSSSRYAAAIFVRNDRDDIQTLSDLRDKSFVAVHKEALGGWLMARRQLERIDIDPYQDLPHLDFANEQQAVVKAVLSGVVDAGTVRTGVIETMVLSGQLRSDALRVLPPPKEQSLNDQNTPILHSTNFYAEWPLTRLGHVPAKLSSAVSVALLSMPKQHPALLTAGLAAWQTPQQYQSVHELMEDLGLTHYHLHAEITIGELYQQHGQLLIFIMTLFTLLGSTNLWTARQWRREKTQRHQLSISLADSEQQSAQEQQRNLQLDTMLNSFADAYLCVDKNWSINEHNTQTLDLLTNGEPVLKGKMLWSIFTELERGKFHESFTRGIPSEFTLYFPPTDRWLEFHTFPAAMNMTIYFRDVSQRIRTNIALEEKERQLNTILLNMLDAVITIDEKGHIQGFNHAAETMFDYPEGEVIGKTISMLMPTPHADQHQDYIQHYLRSGLTRIIGVGRELVGKRRNGEEFTMEITISDIKVKDAHIFIGICRDVSIRKQHELELQRLATAVSQTTDSIFITDSSGLLEYANPSYIKTTGIDTPLGKRHPLFDNDASLLGQDWYNIISGRQHWNGQYPCRRHNGSEYIAETSLTPVLDKQGRVQCFVGVSRTVSQAPSCVSSMQDSRMMTSLSCDVALEIARLLKELTGHMDFAQTSIDSRSPEARHLNQAATTINRAQVLADRLATFGQPAQDTIQNIAPLQLISDTVYLLSTIYAPDVNISFQSTGQLPQIRIAPNAFQQLLMGGMMCAARAVRSQGGSVGVNAEAVHISAEEQTAELVSGDYLRVQVKDSGGGISHLSESPFVDAQQTSLLAQSSRPGLATAFSVASDARGAMSLRNTADNGLLLSVYLPAQSEAPET